MDENLEEIISLATKIRDHLKNAQDGERSAQAKAGAKYRIGRAKSELAQVQRTFEQFVPVKQSRGGKPGPSENKGD